MKEETTEQKSSISNFDLLSDKTSSLYKFIDYIFKHLYIIGSKVENGGDFILQSDDKKYSMQIVKDKTYHDGMGGFKWDVKKGITEDGQIIIGIAKSAFSMNNNTILFMVVWALIRNECLDNTSADEASIMICKNSFDAILEKIHYRQIINSSLIDKCDPARAERLFFLINGIGEYNPEHIQVIIKNPTKEAIENVEIFNAEERVHVIPPNPIEYDTEIPYLRYDNILQKIISCRNDIIIGYTVVKIEGDNIEGQKDCLKFTRIDDSDIFGSVTTTPMVFDPITFEYIPYPMPLLFPQNENNKTSENKKYDTSSYIINKLKFNLMSGTKINIPKILPGHKLTFRFTTQYYDFSNGLLKAYSSIEKFKSCKYKQT